MIKKVMINGRACAGKDTIADYLVRRHGFKKVSFATPLYMIARLMGMKEKDRDLLQKIGETGRKFYNNIWVTITYLKSKWFLLRGYSIVVSDCRRSNEYIKFVSNGFLPIRVSADFDVRVKRAIERDGSYPDTSLWENESETGADNFHYIEIENNGTNKELYEKVEVILQQRK